MRNFLVVAAALVAGAAAFADEGELFLGASAGVDAAWLRHPLAPSSLFPDNHSALVPLPRLALHVDYGLTNELALTIGLAGAATTSVLTTDVDVGAVSVDVVSGTFGELALPIGVRWRFDSGFPVSADVALEGGPALAGYFKSAAVDRAARDSAGRRLKLPLTVADSVVPGGALRAAVGVELRFGGVVGSLRGVLGAAWLRAPVCTLGGVVEVGFTHDVGPE